jgi:hypothetical protein
MHESVRYGGKVMDDFRIEGEEIPDLPIVGPGGFRIFEEVAATLGFRFSSTPRRNIDSCSIFNIHALSLAWVGLGRDRGGSGTAVRRRWQRG